MKVGILTFHRAHNYGAVLQCYALQEVLKGMGHDVEVIDYKQPFIEKFYKCRIVTRSIIKKILSLDFRCAIDEYKKNKLSKKKSLYFSNFISRFINLSKKVRGRNIPQNFDIYIIGSDQMWSYNCVQGYDPIYWGQFKRNRRSKLIGYSISGNGDFFEKIDHKILKHNIESFDNVSFREKTISEFANLITGKTYPITIDPTLLGSKDIWSKLIKKNKVEKPYVLIYQARRYSKDPNFLFRRATEYVTNKNMDVIDLNSCDVSVEDFVSLIYNADCVFTTSFHATVFSIIFNIPFFSFILSDGHDSRYVELLDSLNLKDRLIHPDTPFPFINHISDEEISKRILNLRNFSLQYLECYLN